MSIEIQEKFKKFILDDIFWFNKSELNFGIYKIFRQKEEFIKTNLNNIIKNIEDELSNENKNSFEKLKTEILDYIPPKKHKDIIITNKNELKEVIEKYGNGDTQKLLKQLETISTQDKYNSTKVYEYLYQFFNLYYEKGDFGYTKRSFKTYTVPYRYEEYLLDGQDRCTNETSHEIDYKGEETLFTWKTKDSYYIKSNKFLNSVTLNLKYKDTDYTIHTNIISKDEDIKDDKKVKQYRLISIKKDADSITLNFNISDYATPKHTIYLLMLCAIDKDIQAIDYDAIFKDKKLKEYFELLPLNNTGVQTSLLDENQSKLHNNFKNYFDDEKFIKYILEIKKDKEGKLKSATNIFKAELSGDEDKTQLKSKTSKLMLNKKDYASKIYTKTTAKEFLELDKGVKFEFDDKADIEKLYKNNETLSFFYRLDRGINMFYAGVDSDYFIHKNLKKFLSVELDKFIKNYIFADTDALLAMDESVVSLSKFARVFKNQAKIFIELLSSIEEFQKYLWEKRKMVKSSHYVISSNKIQDEKTLQEVLKNSNQLIEWESLGITKPNIKPSIEELKLSSYPIDTKYFPQEFKYKILSQFDDIEEELSGVLIKSENYQALKFLEPKYIDKKGDGKIKCIYIDPPYNTGNDGFVYKDNFRSASWLSMMNDRLEVARGLMRDDGVIFSQIDDNEQNNLNILLQEKFSNKINNKVSIVIVKMSHLSGMKMSHKEKSLPKVKEYINIYAKNKQNVELNEELVKSNWNEILSRYSGYRIVNDTDRNNYKLWKRIPLNEAIKRYYNKSVISDKEKLDFKIKNAHNIFRTATNNSEIFKKVKKSKEFSKVKTTTGLIKYIYNGEEVLFADSFIKNNKVCSPLSDIWSDIGINNLHNEGRVELKNGKKPEKLLQRIINLSSEENTQDIVLDFFGGSGTTSAVAYKMNKKFISVEMNEYFETKMLARMKHTMFGNSGGIESQRQNGIFQYIELEQYDDIIDNLTPTIEANDSKVDVKYIYEPNKNQINFRMKNEINNPLSTDNSFDLFSSFLFHEGMDLKTVELKNNHTLIATTIDRYKDECAVVFSSDECEAKTIINGLREKYNKKIYSNVKAVGIENIIAETFKGK